MTEYHKSNPFPAKIKERLVLNKTGSSKKTYHIALDLEGSNFSYKVGDAIGIFPHNPLSLVEGVLKALGKTGDEPVTDPRSQAEMSLHHFLLTKANLLRITSPLLKRLAPQDPLLLEENKQARSQYIAEHDLIDLFEGYSTKEVAVQELISFFSPLLPRFYSIASAQASVGNEVHLLVATFTYQHGEKIRSGIGSHFLCDTAVIGETPIPTYMHPTPTFTLPEDPTAPILMIGPGTGVAPYRAFLQERKHQGASGKNWLIFGERNRDCDYYYEDFFAHLANEGFLSLDTAFSRDQQEKIYVQHRLLEKGPEVWEWLESNAYVYICGDARHMAKDVTSALHTIVEQEGKRSAQEAKDYIKQLRKSKRLLMDVY